MSSPMPRKTLFPGLETGTKKEEGEGGETERGTDKRGKFEIADEVP